MLSVTVLLSFSGKDVPPNAVTDTLYKAFSVSPVTTADESVVVVGYPDIDAPVEFLFISTRY